ncbi:putative basic proline-rich protein-like [Iris pallida]|uniref:Basic proline-rich protein-like n=1 Tax=Iris pallida TaxID=29817 RepID=A0AAX6DUA8_IRIPA|nr:putative basic proline-rich protein-like [Iris pallida]
MERGHGERQAGGETAVGAVAFRGVDGGTRGYGGGRRRGSRARGRVSLGLLDGGGGDELWGFVWTVGCGGGRSWWRWLVNFFFSVVVGGNSGRNGRDDGGGAAIDGVVGFGSVSVERMVGLWWRRWPRWGWCCWVRVADVVAGLLCRSVGDGRGRRWWWAWMEQGYGGGWRWPMSWTR